MNWIEIMEAYESNDCESLSEYALTHMERLMEYFDTYMERQASSDFVFLCAMYFINIDRFVDGGEDDVLRGAIGDWEHSVNLSVIQRKFDSTPGIIDSIEDHIRRAPYRIKEEFARLGCALCSGKGYISEKEREVILSWI